MEPLVPSTVTTPITMLVSDLYFVAPRCHNTIFILLFSWPFSAGLLCWGVLLCLFDFLGLFGGGGEIIYVVVYMS